MEDMRAFLADKRRRFWTGLEGAESKTIIIFDSNNQIEQIHCGKKIWEIQRTLKPYQNKKGQSFVVMLAFCVYFFWIGISCLLQKKKKDGASQQTFGHSYFVRALHGFWFLLIANYKLLVGQSKIMNGCNTQQPPIIYCLLLSFECFDLTE